MKGRGDASMFAQFLSRFRDRRRCVGVDLGATSIRVVRMDVQDGMPAAAFVSTRPTPRGAFEHYVLSDPVSVGAALRDALAEATARHYPIALALPAPSVIVKRVSLPKAELGSIRTRVRDELTALAPDR